MGRLYDIALLGKPTTAQVEEVRADIAGAVAPYGLRLGVEIGWEVKPADEFFDEQRAAVALYFGHDNPSEEGLSRITDLGIPVIPIVTTGDSIQDRLPKALRHLNALDYGSMGPGRVAATALESLGLLPRQRRVFLSYRRNEARAAALQLYDELSSLVYEVFLDTHGIPPGADFQSMLWHRLCDSDVLVMLDTASYFESRWTAAEFGRALAKGIPVLRVGWPDATPSPRTGTCSHFDLATDDVDSSTGTLAESVVGEACTRVERLRSRGHAIRRLNMISGIRGALEQVGGKLVAVGASGVAIGMLPDGAGISIYPALGVPTSETLHRAESAATGSVAVVFDHVGLLPEWLGHLDWLGARIPSPRWLKSSELAWELAGWGT